MTPAELLKNLDTYRTSIYRLPKTITKEQLQFLTKAREGEFPVTYETMAELWQKVGWGKIAKSQMLNLYSRFVKNAK